LDLFPGLYKLTDRQLECLICRGVKFPESKGRTIDLSQKITRQTLKEGGHGCVKPAMDSYFTSRCRLSIGLENMQMQGMHFKANHNKLRDMDQELLADLAGNGFEAAPTPCPPLIATKSVKLEVQLASGWLGGWVGGWVGGLLRRLISLNLQLCIKMIDCDVSWTQCEIEM